MTFSTQIKPVAFIGVFWQTGISNVHVLEVKCIETFLVLLDSIKGVWLFFSPSAICTFVCARFGGEGGVKYLNLCLMASSQPGVVFTT